MRLIKNISPMGIKVNISVIVTNDSTMTVELNHGECILVNDLETKSIIIQKKKGNIEVSDKYPDVMTPYQVYKDELTSYHTENTHFQLDELDFPTETKKEESLIVDFVEPDSKTEESSEITEIVPNKGGRPKGSNRKPLSKAQLKKRFREQYQRKKKRKEEAKNNPI